MVRNYIKIVHTKYGTRYVDLKSKEHTMKCIRESFDFDRKFTTNDLLEELQKNTFYSQISRGGLYKRLDILNKFGYLNVKSVKRIKEGGKPTKYYTLTEKSYTKFKRWKDGKRK